VTTLQAPTSGAVVVSGGNAVATRANSGPVSGLANVGIRRAEIKHGVREVVVCKDGSGKVGVSFFAESKGVFVCYVKTGSPAAMAGLRFGDQILQVCKILPDNLQINFFINSKMFTVFCIQVL
jgi:syntenin-1